MRENSLTHCMTGWNAGVERAEGMGWEKRLTGWAWGMSRSWVRPCILHGTREYAEKILDGPSGHFLFFCSLGMIQHGSGGITSGRVVNSGGSPLPIRTKTHPLIHRCCTSSFPYNYSEGLRGNCVLPRSVQGTCALEQCKCGRLCALGCFTAREFP